MITFVMLFIYDLSLNKLMLFLFIFNIMCGCLDYLKLDFQFTCSNFLINIFLLIYKLYTIIQCESQVHYEYISTLAQVCVLNLLHV